MSSEKKSVLILGGVGMVGRSFLSFLLKGGYCKYIRVVDKLLPQIAFMSAEEEELFNDPIVQFIQADLTKENHLDRAFAPLSDGSFDYIFNLAAETRYGQPPALYESRCTQLSALCARRAAALTCKRYVEVSTALVYKSQSRTPSNEESKIDPWTDQAAAKLAGENEVKKIAAESGLDYVILRPSLIYGPADVNGLMPRIVCAAAYVELKETMKFLWDASVKLNTVHVSDVCRAMWTVADTNRLMIRAGSVYNLSDGGDTDAGKVNDLLSQIFHIKVGYHGTILSNVARLRLNDAVEVANEKHMKPWDVICKSHGIERTPLSPFMSKELLDHHHIFVDGSKIERDTDFRYEVRQLTKERMLESIRAAITARIFPPIVDAQS